MRERAQTSLQAITYKDTTLFIELQMFIKLQGHPTPMENKTNTPTATKIKNIFIL